MYEQYLSEIRIFSFGFVPHGWAPCNGQLLSINQNQALFSLLGTMYGGNGTTNFALPNLQTRMAIHFNSTNFPQGQAGGEYTHTLTVNELPAHSHAAVASSNTPNASTPLNNFWAGNSGFKAYSGTPGQAMSATALSSVGGSLPHSNMAPYLVLNFCIATMGNMPPTP